MFEATLQNQIKRIFQIDKVSYDQPGESNEQEGAFIRVDQAMGRIKDGRQLCHVQGRISIFANQDKLKYGYFAKKLSAATQSDKDGLYFYDFEDNRGTYRNIVERSCGFIYLFDSQHDPAIGTITSVDLSYPEGEE